MPLAPLGHLLVFSLSSGDEPKDCAHQRKVDRVRAPVVYIWHAEPDVRDRVSWTAHHATDWRGVSTWCLHENLMCFASMIFGDG